MKRHANGVHNVCSLGQWLDACKELGIEAIDAELIGACWAGEIAAVGYGRYENEAPIENLKKLMIGIPISDGSFMYRWDCCSSCDLKQEMGDSGRIKSARGLSVCADDPRLCNILEQWPPFSEVRFWKRPWVNAVYESGWPVEFRVFVEDSRVIGVSNYYPQRDLPESFVPVAQAAMDMTLPLTEKASAFTADWLLRLSDAKLVYLEGGPPHRTDGGAHMCCFEPGKIDGIALSNRNQGIA